MARVVDVAIRVADLPEFRAFVGAAGDVVREFEAFRASGAGPALIAAIDGLRDAMKDLVTDEQ